MLLGEEINWELDETLNFVFERGTYAALIEILSLD